MRRPDIACRYCTHKCTTEPEISCGSIPVYISDISKNNNPQNHVFSELPGGSRGCAAWPRPFLRPSPLLPVRGFRVDNWNIDAQGVLFSHQNIISISNLTYNYSHCILPRPLCRCVPMRYAVPPNWAVLWRCLSTLPGHDRRVAQIVGLSQRHVLERCRAGGRSANMAGPAPSESGRISPTGAADAQGARERVCCRFFAALLLRDLVARVRALRVDAIKRAGGVNVGDNEVLRVPLY